MQKHCHTPKIILLQGFCLLKLLDFPLDFVFTCENLKRVNSQSETLHQPQMTYVITMDPGLFPVVDEYELTKRDYRQYAKMVSVQ